MPAPIVGAALLKKPLVKFIGKTIAANINKKPKRTACWTVEDSAVPAFRAYQVAQYKVNETGRAIRDGLGITTAQLHNDSSIGGSPDGLFTVAQIADFHLEGFVPICLEMEAGRHTLDPDSGEGLALRNAAYAEFERLVREGHIELTDRFGRPVRRMQPVDGSAPSARSSSRDPHEEFLPAQPPALGSPGFVGPQAPRGALAGMPAMPLILGALVLGLAFAVSRRG